MTSEDYHSKLLYLKSQIKSYPDFPKEGILFRFVFILSLSHTNLNLSHTNLNLSHTNLNITCKSCIEISGTSSQFYEIPTVSNLP